MPTFKLNTLFLGFLVLTTCLHVCSKPLQPSPDYSSGLNKASNVLEKRGIFSDISALLELYNAKWANSAAQTELDKSQALALAAGSNKEEIELEIKNYQERTRFLGFEQDSSFIKDLYDQLFASVKNVADAGARVIAALGNKQAAAERLAEIENANAAVYN